MGGHRSSGKTVTVAQGNVHLGDILKAGNDAAQSKLNNFMKRHGKEMPVNAVNQKKIERFAEDVLGYDEGQLGDIKGKLGEIMSKAPTLGETSKIDINAPIGQAMETKKEPVLDIDATIGQPLKTTKVESVNFFPTEKKQAQQKTPEQHLEDMKTLIGEDAVRAAQALNIKNGGVATQHGLSKAEIAAIVTYTGNISKNPDLGYKGINEALRARAKGDNSKYEKIKPLIDNLISGLEKLPKVQGNTIRGDDMPPNVREALLAGKDITFDSFLSSARGNTVSKDFAEKPDHIHIVSSEGRDISSLSEYAHLEKEVLYLPGTRLKSSAKPTKDVRDGKTTNHFYLEDVGRESGERPVETQPSVVQEQSTGFVGQESEIFDKQSDEPLPRSSNKMEIYIGKDGKKRFVKHYDNPDQAYTEAVANNVYKEMGAEVPNTTLVKRDGKNVVATEAVEGPTMQKFTRQMGAFGAKNAEKFLQHFITDVWLANYDAAGLEIDNIIKTDTGVARIDNGAALGFRARGAYKTDEELNEDIMTDIGKYVNGGSGGRDGYAQVFKAAGITSTDSEAFGKLIEPQVAKLRELRERTKNFETLVPKAEGVSDATRGKMLKIMQDRAKMILGD